MTTGILDSHHHLWNLFRVHYPWLMARGVRRFFGDPAPIQRNYPVEEFRATARASGVRASVHIQVGAADGLDEARWVDSVAAANPGWPAAQVAFADLAGAGLETTLDAYAELPSVRGIRQIVGRAPDEDAAAGSGRLLENPAFLEGLRRLAERGLRFDLQLTPELMESATRLLGEVPELPVALCHAGSPRDRSEEGLRSWARRLRALADLPRAACKLSGLGMFEPEWTAESIRPIVEACLEIFGPERCMFGSNFPVDSLTGSYPGIVGAYREIVPPEHHAHVFRNTAAAFYGLESLPYPAADSS